MPFVLFRPTFFVFTFRRAAVVVEAVIRRTLVTTRVEQILRVTSEWG